ncbi:MAG: nitrile hydratase subunit alpha [Solirubrobacteraceae bacterium MAG38_C4-C5]|nr:nitrile hydratase subunit alpha [Candidatus Siliceabacter maunaloa]
MSGSQAHTHAHDLDEPALRARALESLLLEKGLLASDTVERIVRVYEHHVGPMNGARLVARSWVDRAFRARLLADGSAAAQEMGVLGLGTDRLVAVENAPRVHNLVVCTLCSCYPWSILGLPPTWYKDPAYRSRAVLEPRTVLAEFGTILDESVEVRLWDSSAEVRYLVVPERPAGTAELDGEALAALVTRDAMIGVTRLAAAA